MQRFKYQKTLFLSYAGLLLVTLVITIVFFSVYTIQTQSRKIQNNLYTISEKTITELDSRISDMNRITLYISANNLIRDTFLQAKNTQMTNFELYEKTRDTLNAITTPVNAAPYRISLFNKNGNFIYTGIPISQQKLSEHMNAPDFHQWYASMSATIGNGVLIDIPEIDLYSEQTDMVTVYRNIFNTPSETSVLGIVEVQFRYSYLQDILNLDDVGINVCLVNEEGLVYYTSGSSDSSAFLQNLFADKNPLSPGTGIQNGFVYSIASSQNTDWFLILSESSRSIWLSIIPIFIAMFLLAAILLILGFCYIYLISKRVTKPLNELIHSVENVSIHNFRLQIYSDEFTDEFEALNCSFDSMFQRLQQSMDELVILKAHNLRARFNALQAQISPHFLYNMFAVIKNMCRENNVTAISHACDYLADMLRYITKFDNTSIADISDELRYTENYLKLMKMRYEDMFSFEIARTGVPSAETIQVPKLILLPVVENSFQHGFKSVLPPWQIKINCSTNHSSWRISIWDNGSGITPGEQKKILSDADKLLVETGYDQLAIGGLGLVNTIVRLKLYFKDDYYFKISLPPQGGTEIILGGNFNVKNIIS